MTTSELTSSKPELLPTELRAIQLEYMWVALHRQLVDDWVHYHKLVDSGRPSPNAPDTAANSIERLLDLSTAYHYRPSAWRFLQLAWWLLWHPCYKQ